SSRLHLTMQTLGVALGFVGNYAPRGLSPQTGGMPAILRNVRRQAHQVRKTAAKPEWFRSRFVMFCFTAV
ncbi:MAG: hypothetical protein MR713_10160, partial [Firmicutes bacterium]|nr:hypothetical protein [Bacillota bacterium]